MRTYQIYWIGEEFAHYFYGRERNFFQLFFESSCSGTDKQQIIEKQVQYITNKFAPSKVKQLLTEALGERHGFSIEKGGYYRIELPNEKGGAELFAESECLYLKATGSYESETIFFHALKKMNACLFAVDFERNNYGWLQPIKKEILFK
ncbi:sporulation inhibitor of replication protein SirA [Bacillus xiapuensis]|uniref:sporulation inhibitor of replication protein SirA n=1 Tax=Bacillus xiapuensis TaxID=2014075 RepID=UPI000C23A1C3|nr:sporulation inhibitor of replication protein SirA [Bacillus xiapuensis]